MSKRHETTFKGIRCRTFTYAYEVAPHPRLDTPPVTPETRPKLRKPGYVGQGPKKRSVSYIFRGPVRPGWAPKKHWQTDKFSVPKSASSGTSLKERVMLELLALFDVHKKFLSEAQYLHVIEAVGAFVLKFYGDDKDARGRKSLRVKTAKRKLIAWCSYHIAFCHYGNLWHECLNCKSLVVDLYRYKAVKSIVINHYPVSSYCYGNELSYLRSSVRILTIGYNGSKRDITLIIPPELMKRYSEDIWRCALDEALPESVVDDILAAAKNYFSEVKDGNYREILGHSFFDKYRRILKWSCKGSYVLGDPEAPNVALHLDILCPFSTDPHWGKLHKPMVVPLLADRFSPLSEMRLRQLQPDVIFAGLSEVFLVKFPTVAPWTELITVEKDNVRFTYLYSILEFPHESGVGTKRCFIVNAPAKQSPFGLLSDDEVELVCKKTCAPLIEEFLRTEKLRRAAFSRKIAADSKKRENAKKRRKRKAKKVAAARLAAKKSDAGKVKTPPRSDEETLPAKNTGEDAATARV